MTPTNFRILMVEDDPRHHELYKECLTSQLPVTVEFATDGEKGLEAIREALDAGRPPDMVVLDLEMPKLTGQEVLSRIRSQHGLLHMPVMILTGSGNIETQMELLDAGADDFIEKGATPEIFVARVQAQMRHKLAIDRLESLAVDRDMFAAGVLHDIRNIESTIVSLCQLAKDELAKRDACDRQKVDDYMQRLDQHASRLGRYASNVIQSVRETGAGPKLGPQDPAGMFKWIQDVLSSGDEAESRFDLVMPDKLRPVQADENYLRLALLNIIQNAVKFARPRVPLVITISQEDGPTDPMGRTTIVTRILDNGRGMHPDDLEKVFRTYEKGSQGAADSEDDGGFGLGLSMVAKVIAGMGGSVRAELPKADKGTAICVTLPVPHS